MGFAVYLRVDVDAHLMCVLELLLEHNVLFLDFSRHSAFGYGLDDVLVVVYLLLCECAKQVLMHFACISDLVYVADTFLAW